MDPVDAPTTAGVYYLLGARREVLYVGKAANLRRRLGDHVRSGRWDGVVDVRWEELPSEALALAREADVLVALRPPHNKNHIDDFFAGVAVADRALVLVKDGGDFGCFPQLGTGAMSEIGRACIDGFNALNRLRPRVDDRQLRSFLSGRTKGLTVDLDDEQPHVALGVRKDLALAGRFFDAGPKRLRVLRSRHACRGLVTRGMFEEWIRADVYGRVLV